MSEFDWPHDYRVRHNVWRDHVKEVAMGNVNLETIVQVVTIVGAMVALMLAGLQAAETWLDIGEKLKKRRKKSGRD